jgi:hypothetical protein
MSVQQIGDEYVIRISAKSIKKSEINSFLKFVEMRNQTAGRRNSAKAISIGKLMKKDSLEKYGPK